MGLVDVVKEIAGAKGATPGQIALAWLLAQGETSSPIPGTKRLKYLEENARAAGVSLTPEELAAQCSGDPNIRSALRRAGNENGGAMKQQVE